MERGKFYFRRLLHYTAQVLLNNCYVMKKMKFPSLCVSVLVGKLANYLAKYLVRIVLNIAYKSKASSPNEAEK